MKRVVAQDLSGAAFRECVLTRTDLVGVVMQDAVIDAAGDQPRGQRRRGDGLRRGGARPTPPRPPAHPVGRPRRPAARRAAASRGLGGDRGADPPLARHRARRARRRVVGCADPAPPGLRRTTRGSGAAASAPRDPFTPMGLGVAFVPDEQGLDPSAGAARSTRWSAVRDDQAAELEHWLDSVTARAARRAGADPRRRPVAALRGRAVRGAVPRTRCSTSEWAHHAASASATSSRRRGLSTAQ